MTQEEKSFKIQKISKYSDDLYEVNREVSKKAVVTGIYAIVAAFCFSKEIEMPIDVIRYYFAAPISLGVTMSSLKNMLIAISEKTMLKGKIEDIQDELNFETYMEEERGKKLW